MWRENASFVPTYWYVPAFAYYYARTIPGVKAVIHKQNWTSLQIRNHLSEDGNVSDGMDSNTMPKVSFWATQDPTDDMMSKMNAHFQEFSRYAC